MSHSTQDRITRRKALGHMAVATSSAIAAAAFADNLLAQSPAVAAETATEAASSSTWGSAEFSADGRHVIISGPGIVSAQGAITCHITRPGKDVTLRSTDPAIAVRLSDNNARAHYADTDNGFAVTLQLRRDPTNHAISLQGSVQNTGTDPLRLFNINVFSTLETNSHLVLEGPAKDWLATQFMGFSQPLTMDEVKGDDHWIGGCTGIYRPDGAGMLIGPAGSGANATPVFVSESRDGSVRFRVESWMCGITLDPGETRVAEETLFIFRKPQDAAKQWAKHVAAAYHARTKRGPFSGWCSWYDKTTQITESHVLAQVDTIRANPAALPLHVVQVDDGYQRRAGDWRANDQFPHGMAYTAEHIARSGLIPGIWISPLKVDPELPWAKAHPECLQHDPGAALPRFEPPNPYYPRGKLTVDPTHPESQAFIRRIIRDAVAAGYQYLKLDFTDIQQTDLFDNKKTQLQAVRDLFALYRQEAGERIYINACISNPEIGVVGYADACRIGPDSFAGGLAEAMDPVMHAQLVNGIWFANDPDVTYISPKLDGTVGVSGGLTQLRTWHSIVGLTGGLAMTSDPLQEPDSRPHWNMMQMLTPPAPQNTRLLGLGTDDARNTFLFDVRKPWARYAVCLLINRDKQNGLPATIRPADAGLDTQKPIAVWSFWDDAFLGFAGRSWATNPLSTNESQLVRLTEIDPAARAPVCIGSTLHITCGTAEVQNIRTSGNTCTIDLTDAGALEGALTLYSKRPLRLLSATGCQAHGLTSPADHVWHLPLSGRHGTHQRVILAIG